MAIMHHLDDLKKRVHIGLLLLAVLGPLLGVFPTAIAMIVSHEMRHDSSAACPDASCASAVGCGLGLPTFFFTGRPCTPFYTTAALHIPEPILFLEAKPPII
jgi:hypothetical protein